MSSPFQRYSRATIVAGAAAAGLLIVGAPVTAFALTGTFSSAPANAHAEVLQRVHFVAGTRGGAGAVREVCDAILRAQDKYDGLLAAAIGA